jgi:uncharacterized damage-inducible protein DinB
MSTPADLRASVLGAWRTNNRVTTQLVERLPPALWELSVPDVPRRTIRAIAAHPHNSRCGWLRTRPRARFRTPASIGAEATPRQLTALNRSSSDGGAARARPDSGDRSRRRKSYVWRNSSPYGPRADYFVAHEAHHRGQIVIVARANRAPTARRTGARWWWKIEKAR